MSLITVPLPLNIEEDELLMYQPYMHYELSPQKIKKIRNVFVAFSGFCMNSRGLIKECHHAYPSQHHDYLSEAAHYYYDTVDHPENLIMLDDDRSYLLIHHPWFNYYHWVCESIFRLWMIRRRLDHVVLLLPDYYQDADFIMGSLEPFNIKEIFFIPGGKSLMVRNICLPQIKPVCDSYNARHIRQVRAFYRNYVLLNKKISTNLGDKLYVSRELAKRRKVINEPEVVDTLKSHGFTVFHPEKFTFLEQVAIFSKAKYLVGEHGSGLTNLLFMPANSSVLELHKNKTNELNHPSPLFWYMADALGINYFHQSCETEGRDDYFDGNYLVDIKLLSLNLLKMLK
ncbi:MAG: glycosyltransferase family 61 protein [Bacteroidetes bacterium]|nr:glycosyltransferase family 61 protein [Bacteroidota bacterium]